MYMHMLSEMRNLCSCTTLTRHSIIYINLTTKMTATNECSKSILANMRTIVCTKWTFIHIWQIIYKYIKYVVYLIPLHLYRSVKFCLYPFSQEHLKNPGSFIQRCWHPPLPCLHSFLSTIKLYTSKLSLILFTSTILKVIFNNNIISMTTMTNIRSFCVLTSSSSATFMSVISTFINVCVQAYVQEV